MSTKSHFTHPTACGCVGDESPPAFGRSKHALHQTRVNRSGDLTDRAGRHDLWRAGCGYPAWSLREEDSRPLLKHALEAGINFFDTANMYSLGSSEEILGRALKDYANRDDVVICTKVRHTMRPGPNGQGLSRKAIMAEIDHSLRGLRLRRHLHDPSDGQPDPGRRDAGSPA